ncbi:MAG: chemotaxis protein CheB, partial [Planctomycetota bacterium]
SLEGFQKKVIDAVLGAARCNRSRLEPKSRGTIHRPASLKVAAKGPVIAIGISAGGPATLHQLVPALPENLPPVIITQHMPAEFTGPFARRLNAQSPLTIKEAAENDVLQSGHVFIAPGSHHLTVRRRGSDVCIHLDDGPKVSGFRPSVDVMFESVAKVVGRDAIGLVMTGMGDDGADGIRALKAAGARTLAQDQETSIVYGMPKAAAETGCVDRIVSLSDIPEVLVQLLHEAVPAGS